jgi:alpha-N-arabinofuranosidase
MARSFFAGATVKKITGNWQRYEVILKTGEVATTNTNRFTLMTTKPGTVWLQQVYLFPETYRQRPNGNRPDLMQMLADMKPQFLRLPGGNYLEGDTIPERFD